VLYVIQEDSKSVILEIRRKRFIFLAEDYIFIDLVVMRDGVGVPRDRRSSKGVRYCDRYT
jgi:hypothetical protein